MQCLVLPVYRLDQAPQLQKLNLFAGPHEHGPVSGLLPLMEWLYWTLFLVELVCQELKYLGAHTSKTTDTNFLPLSILPPPPAVNKLLTHVWRNFSQHVVLLTIQPISIGFKSVKFQEYKLLQEYVVAMHTIYMLCYEESPLLLPCSYKYEDIPLNVRVVDKDQDWPKEMKAFPLEWSDDNMFDIMVGDTTVKFKFTLYRQK